MKLDESCIVAVLETVEESCTYYEPFRYSFSDPLHDKLKPYTYDQILYHIQYCQENGYLKGCSILGNGAMITVCDLSKDGHAYLKNIRDNSLLGQIKQMGKDAQRVSIKKIPGIIWVFIRDKIKPAWWPI